MSAPGMLVLRGVEAFFDGDANEIAIEAGRVVEAAPNRRTATCAIDLDGRVVLPGLVNGHDHLGFSTFVALGAPPYESVYAWARALDAGRGDERAAAALAPDLSTRLWMGGLRNLVCGVTAVVHHDAFHPRLAEATFPIRVLQRYAFAHSLKLEPRPTRRPRDRVFMIHAAEGTDAECRGEIARLDAEGLLGPGTVLVHAIGISDADIARIGETEAAVVWCPESNQRLYGTTAPVDALRRAGVRLGIGSDSPVSGVRDALSNLAVARGLSSMTPAELLRCATRETAAIFGLPVGGTAPGSDADLIVVSSVDDLLAGRRAAIDLVLVAGEPVYGDPKALAAAGVRHETVVVDGVERGLAKPLADVLAGVLKRWPVAGKLDWSINC